MMSESNVPGGANPPPPPRADVQHHQPAPQPPTATNQTYPQTQPGKPEGDLKWIRFNYQYLIFTIPGIIKVVQFVLGIICIATASPAMLPVSGWYLFVVIISFIFTILWIFIYLLGIRENLRLPISWITTELVNNLVICTLYITAFISQLAIWANVGERYLPYRSRNLAAGSFAIFNFLAYVAGAAFLYTERTTTPY